jgi:serine protease DegQ
VTHVPAALSLLTAAALALTGCTDGPDLPGASPASPDATGSPAEPAEPAAEPPAEATAEATAEGLAGVADIVDEVSPSVVALEIQATAAGQPVQGVGSGVIYDADGIIVTNAHVVAEASEVVVLLASGERLPAEVVAADARSDLAVVRVDASGLPAAVFADELPDVGDVAIAMGNPLGLENSVTAGIVSGVERSIPVDGATILTGLIQTDASISPGNSGGALVDGAGRVIAINVGKAATVQGAEGLGFAVPATTVRRAVPQLLEDGRVAHPYIGIRGATLSQQAAERFGFTRDRGVVVAGVEPGGPADEAGIVPGDLIVAVGDTEVDELGDLLTELRRYEPGDTVPVTLVRDGEEITVDVTVGELPEG